MGITLNKEQKQTTADEIKLLNEKHTYKNESQIDKYTHRYNKCHFDKVLAHKYRS
jgi:hypothetical protein